MNRKNLKIYTSYFLTSLTILMCIWCWIVYPFVYSASVKFEAAHASSDSEVGVMLWHIMSSLASGWFVAILMISLIVGFIAAIMQTSEKRRKLIQYSLLVVPVVSIIGHCWVDGFEEVYSNFKLVINSPKESWLAHYVFIDML